LSSSIYPAAVAHFLSLMLEWVETLDRDRQAEPNWHEIKICCVSDQPRQIRLATDVKRVCIVPQLA
jgi:hypothetical protein